MSLVFRLRRVDEFVRIQTLLRIEQETERTEKIKAEREFLVEQVRDTVVVLETRFAPVLC